MSDTIPMRFHEDGDAFFPNQEYLVGVVITIIYIWQRFGHPVSVHACYSCAHDVCAQQTMCV